MHCVGLHNLAFRRNRNTDSLLRIPRGGFVLRKSMPADDGSAAAQLRRVPLLSWSAALCAASMGSAGLAFAGGLGRFAQLGTTAGSVGYGTAALLAYSGRKGDSALVGAATSALCSIALLPAWRTSRSPIVLNAAGMSLVSLGFYSLKRLAPEE